MDWRDEYYFSNPKLHKAFTRLEKLGADIEYIRWLTELLRRADTFNKPRPIRRVTVQLPSEPAVSAATELMEAQSTHDLDAKVEELRQQLERGQWYASSHFAPGVRNSASQNMEAHIHRLIADAYLRTAIDLVKKGALDPRPKTIYDHNPNSPGSFALGTSNALATLESRSAKTKSREVDTRGRRSDIWGTFFLIALSEHLRKSTKNNQPYYTLCSDTLRAARRSTGKSGASAKVRVSRFKAAHPDWQNILGQAACDYNAGENVETAALQDLTQQIIAMVQFLVQTGRLSPDKLRQAIDEGTISELLESLAEQKNTR